MIQFLINLGDFVMNERFDIQEELRFVLIDQIALRGTAVLLFQHTQILQKSILLRL